MFDVVDWYHLTEAQIEWLKWWHTPDPASASSSQLASDFLELCFGTPMEA